MRIQRNACGSLDEAEAMRSAFPSCGVCKSSLKIQALHGEFWLLCMKNGSHRSVSDRP